MHSAGKAVRKNKYTYKHVKECKCARVCVCACVHASVCVACLHLWAAHFWLHTIGLKFTRSSASAATHAIIWQRNAAWQGGVCGVWKGYPAAGVGLRVTALMCLTIKCSALIDKPNAK